MGRTREWPDEATKLRAFHIREKQPTLSNDQIKALMFEEDHPKSNEEQKKDIVSNVSTFIQIDESTIHENLLIVLNDPHCKPTDRIRATQLALELLQRKDQILKKPQALMPPEQEDIDGFTA